MLDLDLIQSMFVQSVPRSASRASRFPEFFKSFDSMRICARRARIKVRKWAAKHSSTQARVFEVHCWCGLRDRASTLLHCYRVYIHATVTGGVIQFQEINKHPPRCCGSPPQWSGTGASFPIPLRILVKYEETARADTMQDDPDPHVDLGSSKWERNESSLCRSRTGVFQIAKVIFFVKLL